jgi:hypothetical protein
MRVPSLGGFLKLSKARKRLFVEAWIGLVWARLLLRALPFRRLTSIVSFPTRATGISDTAREQLRLDVRWAIERASSYLPGETVCFPRAIAAQFMCRKRGISTIMYYGAAMDPAMGLQAHVWVQDGPEGVIGHSGSARYGVLARFPA